MTTKKYSQFGTASVIILLPLLVIFLVMFFLKNSEEKSETLIFAALSLLMTLTLLTFYKLDIKIDETHLSFKFGIGIIQKKYKLTTITSCKSVTNSILNGLGIRIINNGILFNVSGLEAIELTFENKKRVVRIGSDCPKEIVEELSKYIGINHKH